MKVNRILFVCLLTLACAVGAIGQERVTSPLGFSIQIPYQWQAADKGFLDANVKKLDVSDEALDKLLKSSNNSVVVMAFIKYDPTTREGVIPTIQVRMLPNPIGDFPTFMAAFVRSMSPAKVPFEDYQFIGEPREVSVSGYRAVLVTSKYILRTQDGQTLEVRSRIYAIPYGKQFFQVTFMDNPKVEDCSQEYDVLVKSMAVGREAKKI